MVLKEAYRYQNYLRNLFNATEYYLRDEKNIMKIIKEHQRKKAQPGAEDEITDNLADRPLNIQADDVVLFGVALQAEKERVAAAIDDAKAKSCPSIDRDLANNRSRQSFISALKRMTSFKQRERITPGTAFCFNAEGNQVSFRYDVKETTELDFNRNDVKRLIDELSSTSDTTSNQIDQWQTTVEVAFEPRFNVNDDFEEEVVKFSKSLH